MQPTNQDIADRLERIEALLMTLVRALAEDEQPDPLLHEAGLYPDRDQSKPL